jgi:hypothetical protein
VVAVLHKVSLESPPPDFTMEVYSEEGECRVPDSRQRRTVLMRLYTRRSEVAAK